MLIRRFYEHEIDTAIKEMTAKGFAFVGRGTMNTGAHNVRVKYWAKFKLKELDHVSK